MRLLWLTDIHLNFLEEEERSHFYDTFPSDIDALFITGDIAEAPSIEPILSEISRAICKPIYFVLGNHDYYFGNVSIVRKSLNRLCQKSENLFWLNDCKPIALDNDTWLIGVDGWADGRYGNYPNTRINIKDSRLINELFQASILGRYPLLDKMQELADADALLLEQKLDLVIKQNPKQVIIITHVPPFKETALHQGKISGDDFLPFFSSKATGDILNLFAEKYPKVNFTVFCGHTHDYCQHQAQSNLMVYVGKAEYYMPENQAVIDTEDMSVRLE